VTELGGRVGEVIESGTAGFTAQCYDLYSSPPLGSLVKAAEEATELFAIVCNASTSGIEPGRRPIARGRDETSEEAVYTSSPQISKLLRTEFEAVIVGYRENGSLHHYLPPRPARIHSFVYGCAPEEVREFSRSFVFLSLLLRAGMEVPAEEIVAAALRRMSAAAEDPHAFLVAAGKELAAQLSGDFGRLKTILSRLGTD
jgi:hypothetical protein